MDVSVSSISCVNFRANLQRLMIQARVNQKELAERSGISRVYLNRLLQGRQVPRVDVLDQLAAALGVPTEKLIATPRRKPVAAG